MPLVNLLNLPKNKGEWDIFAFSHRDSHTKIRQAILAQKNVNLPEYVIDPIPDNDLKGWIERNQEFHNDMNGELGLQGSDLQDVDFKDQKQLQSWFYNHFLEHQSAEQALEI